MLRHIALTLTAILSFMVVLQGQASTIEEIAQLNWSKESLAELKKLIPDQKAAQQFSTEALLKEPHTEQENIYRLDVSQEVAVEYEFVDLKGDGSVQFVCLLDISGRMRPTKMMVVENDHGQFKTAYLTGGEGGLGMGQLQYIIKDIKHDGKSEITLSDPLEPFEGGTVPTPYLEHIYVYKNGKLVQSDHEFIEYYKNELLQRREEINDLLLHGPAPDASPEERADYRKRVEVKKKEIAALSKIVSER